MRASVRFSERSPPRVWTTRSTDREVTKRPNRITAALGHRRTGRGEGLGARLESAARALIARRLAKRFDKSNSERTHTSDALGYLVEEEFGLKGFAGFRQERIL